MSKVIVKMDSKVLDDLVRDNAIAFLWWMFDNTWVNGKSISQDGKKWYRQYTSPDKREYKTTEELYEIYKQSQSKEKVND